MKVAGSSLGFKHTLTTREKMKQIYSAERKNRIGSLNRGRPLSLETRQKQRVAALNRSVEKKENQIKASTAFNQKTFSIPTMKACL